MERTATGFSLRPRLSARLLGAAAIVATSLLGLFLARPAHSAPSFLTISARHLDYQGQTVNLRGENFNNEPALSYCCGGTSTSQINVNQSDYDQIASLGANHVRFGLDWAWYNRDRAGFFQVMDQHLNWAGQAHLWVIPVMYEPPGGSDGGYGGQDGFWGSSTNRQALTSFWADFASHYQDNATMAGYDIFNEPAPPSEGAYDSWAQSTYNAITGADPNHFVAVEVSSATWDYPNVNGSRILWSGHCYASVNHDGCNYPGATQQPNKQPYWVGEVGTQLNEGTSYVPGNLTTWNQNGISWTHFVMHEQGFGLYQNWNAGNFNNGWSAMLAVVRAGFQGAVRPGDPGQVQNPIPAQSSNPATNPPSNGTLQFTHHLDLNTGTAVTAGSTVTASAQLTNPGNQPVTVRAVVLAARPPGGSNQGGPFADFAPEHGPATIPAGGSITVTASRTFDAAGPLGSWYGYATYQSQDGRWHDDTTRLNFSVIDASTAIQVLEAPAVVTINGSQVVGTVTGFFQPSTTPQTAGSGPVQ